MDVHPTKNVSIGIDPYPTCKNDGFTVFFHFFFRFQAAQIGSSTPKVAGFTHVYHQNWG
jgi:hypothetical protein